MTLGELLENIHRGLLDGMLDANTPVELWYEHPDLDKVNMRIHSPKIEVDKGLLRLGNVDNITW